MNEAEIKGRSLNELAQLCHSIAVEKGFWDEDTEIVHFVGKDINH